MRYQRFILVFLSLSFILSTTLSCNKKQGDQLPGRNAKGEILLPNRWTLTPAGHQVQVGDLPLNMVISPDERYMAITNNGYSDQYISIIDLSSKKEIQQVPVDKSFLGIAFSPDGQSLYVSGGGNNRIFIYAFMEGHASLKDSIVLGENKPGLNIFPAGLAVSPDSKNLYVVTNLSNTLLIFNLLTKKLVEEFPVGEYPYNVVLSPDGNYAFVSNWGARSVSVFDLKRTIALGSIPVNGHPNSMVTSPDSKYIYVANGNSDNISGINIQTLEVIETIDLAPYQDAPPGSTPNGLAIAPDGSRLYIANATNNDVAVVDLKKKPARVLGLIPVGWYPTAVTVDKNHKTLYVANGKGLESKANPEGPQPTLPNTPETQYIGGLLKGTLSIIEIPRESQLRRYTASVHNNNFNNEITPMNIHKKSTLALPTVIPRYPGEPSVIKYVIYIIKENRTYDQVLGDLPQGNGDSSLTLFGRDVSPNHHNLAETFTLFDNFYVDSEVSADGHEWSMGAMATDFVEKVWPSVYSGRRIGYPSEGAYPIAFPDAGYIWDAAAQAGISYRSYGEFVTVYPDSTIPPRAKVPGLENHFCPTYNGLIGPPDIDKVKEYIKEFKEFEISGNYPRLQILRLTNDHTMGTRPGRPTPRAMVADNDLALGRIVEAISRSRFWKETAIFVLEDDSQNGPDHVDCHRSVAFVISPYVKRGFVDHTLYDTVCMLKTIELILGLPPMSQYDAAAIPMLNCFQETPDFTPYTCLPNTIPLDEMNDSKAYGAEKSMAMDFDEVDRAPEQELNEIIWKSVKGSNSEMPRPHSNRKWIER